MRKTIEQLQMMRESEDRVEFKKGERGNVSYNGGSKTEPSDRRRCILGYVTALCNEKGGTMVIGMHDSYPHKVIGTKQCENAIGQLESDIYRDSGIRTDVYELFEDDKRVLVIDVPPRPRGRVFKFEDVALMREMPNMTIFVPCDPTEMEKAVFAAAEIDGPVYIRVARPVCEDITTEDTPFIPGKANILKDGNDVCIITMGLMVPIALKAAEMLEAEGISAAVVNMHTVKPIDAETILAMNEKCKGIVTAEEHSVIGGLGSAVAEVLAGHAGAKFERVGIQDKFGKSGKPAELFAAYGLTAENIVEKCKATLA